MTRVKTGSFRSNSPEALAYRQGLALLVDPGEDKRTVEGHTITAKVHIQCKF